MSSLAPPIACTESMAPILSTRGMKALARPPLLRCAVFENQYSESNPQGLINIGTAENASPPSLSPPVHVTLGPYLGPPDVSLMTDWLINFFATKQLPMTYSDFTYGTALGGSTRLFAALRHLTSNYFDARIPIEREHVIAGSGCGSVIDLLVSCIADAGDGILVSKPFYNGFSASFECRNEVVPVGVELREGFEAGVEAIAAFEEALVQSELNGVQIRAVMLCNPNNPLGFCYSKEVLLAYCKFVEKHNLHLIVDEIYALSTFATPDNPTAQPFVSILSLDTLRDAGCQPSRIHAIYGSSKDWSSNGLRIGALISQANPDLHAAMESSCLLMKISSAADILWSGLLLDPVGLPTYINLNRALLAESYARAVSFLKAHSIPYRLSNAGHFIFIDLRRHLPSHNAQGKLLATPLEQEEELAARFNRGGIIVARGTAYCMPVPGWFRLTFTLRKDYFELALQRLEKCLGLAPTVSVAFKSTEDVKDRTKVVIEGVQQLSL